MATYLRKLYVFHPSPYMVDEIDRLLNLLAPDLSHENIVVPELLDEAMIAGVTDALVARVQKALSNINSEPKGVILCSCSTFGGYVEELQNQINHTIIRIDRPMAEQAVCLGTRIGIAAALESTIEPTRSLLTSVARSQGKEIAIDTIFCEEAWAYKQAGDLQGYISAISRQVRCVASEFDVIVLAQASMAPALSQLKDLAIPVLSSPELAIERAKEMCRQD